MNRSLLTLALVALLASSLSACGRKGTPDEPENAVYPRVYPYTPQPGRGEAAKDDNADFQPPKPRPQSSTTPELNFRNGY